MSSIVLSAATRSSLLSAQNTADLMATTQNRLSTGKKVNSALDNPTNFFTASGLDSRASDLSNLLDGGPNGGCAHILPLWITDLCILTSGYSVNKGLVLATACLLLPVTLFLPSETPWTGWYLTALY